MAQMNTYQHRIEINPGVMLGKPVIRGTRITVDLILRQFTQGLAIEDILRNYPHLTREDVVAAMAYATELVEEESVFPLSVKSYDHAQAAAR